MEEELEQWRKSTGLSQKEFAKLMGVPLRTYEDLISKKRVRPVHISAAKWACVSLFFDIQDINDDMASGDYEGEAVNV